MKKTLRIILAALAASSAAWLFAQSHLTFDPESAVSEFKNQAQQVQETHAAPKSNIRVETKLVSVDVAAKNGKGQPITDLKKEDFKIFEDGFPQKIEHFSPGETPLAVALVLDVSGCPPASVYQMLHRAAETTLTSLKNADQAALYTFSQDVQKVVSLTQDKKPISDYLKTLSLHGYGHNIGAAVREAAGYLTSAAPDSRRAIILVTEADFGAGTPSVGHQALIEELLNEEVSVYAIMLHYSGFVGYPMAQVRTNIASGTSVYVPDIVEQTGGELFSTQTHTPNELGDALISIVSALKTRYTLGYYPNSHPANDDKANKRPGQTGEFHAIKVELISERGTKGKDYKLVAKKGYYINGVPATAKP